MQVVLQKGKLIEAKVDIIAGAVTVEHFKKGIDWKALEHLCGGGLQIAAKDREFTGKSGEELLVPACGEGKARWVLLLGMGKQAEVTVADWLTLGAQVVRGSDKVKGKAAVIDLGLGLLGSRTECEALARGAVLGGYRFHEYKKGDQSTTSKLSVVFAKEVPKGATQSFKHGVNSGEAASFARDLVNRSPLHLNPPSFAKLVQKMGKVEGLKVKVLEPAALKKENMNLLLGVGAGSMNTPRLVHMTYTPKATAASSKKGKGKESKPLVLVGKGVTFDSGGLSLKPPAAMYGMKMDMGGAAAVVGAMMAIARRGGKRTVHGIISLAENMPSGTAIRPGDVITGAAGKSVEINNTDAEGRLVLADALHYATRLKPEWMIDLATLTGACMVALGDYTTGLFAGNDKLAEGILRSAEQTGEDVWRMPLTKALKDQLKSDIADLRNTGDRMGGAITAGLFLQEFVGDYPWAHMDIAGPATSAKDAGAYSKGGTGIAVATLVELVASYD